MGSCLAFGLVAFVAPRSGEAKTLFDYFQTTPIVGNVAQAPWGASNVQPRDQDNGLEDKSMKSYSYWDGRIVKAADGTYHLFGSRWNQSLGHWSGWPTSVCVHATSANSPLGPYVDQGQCYTDQSGKGHNVMAGQRADGGYFIQISETRPASIYSSSSLDGPWTFTGQQSNDHPANPVNGSAGSNTTLWVRSDGTYLMTDRNGVILTSTNIVGPFKVQNLDSLVSGTCSAPCPSVYANIPAQNPGMATTQSAAEDPCIWSSGGKYHIVYNYPLDRKMYHLMSSDGISNWKLMGLAVDATKPFIKYTDGTTNIWNKLERPQVYLEGGHVKYFTFAAIDVDKGNDLGNDTHGSKIVVVPFDGVTFDIENSGDTSAATGAGGSIGTGGTSSTGGGGALGSGGNGGRPGNDAGPDGSTLGKGGAAASGGAASGGSVGAGGAATGGTTTSAGSTAGRPSVGGATLANTGGTLGAGGGNTSGDRGSGGSVASGGATGLGDARPGEGSGPSQKGSASSGCSCMVGVTAPRRSATLPCLLALALALLATRRRRSPWSGFTETNRTRRSPWPVEVHDEHAAPPLLTSEARDGSPASRGVPP